MGHRISGDAKIAGRVDCRRSPFQREQGWFRSRGHRRRVKEWLSFCPNEIRPKPKPNSAVLPQKMSRFTISPNLLKVRCIDRDLGSRFNRYQHQGNSPLEHAPDRCWILEDICVVNLDRMPGPETKRTILSLATQENDMMNSRSEFGMKHLEGCEIGQRAERDINHAPILPQRSGQRGSRRRFNPEVLSRSRARMHLGNLAAESANKICCDRGRCGERGISEGRANAGNSQIGASEGQQDCEGIVHFAERRSNGSVGVEPNSGRFGAGQAAAEEEEENRDGESEEASAFALRYRTGRCQIKA